jgi:lysozyme family protein
MTKLTESLGLEYQRLFDTCQIRPERRAEIDAAATKIIAGKARYAAVGKQLSVPWFVIGVVHSLEANSDFARHLHNGDPLTARTVQVPKGRPPTGQPPFTWEASAMDALTFDKSAQWTDWSVPGILYKWESYNGLGYRKFHPEVLSPYLWSFTNHYTRGKYVADGTFSPTAVSKQTGAAALLRRLAEKGEVTATSAATEPELLAAIGAPGGLRYKPNAVQPGAIALQQFLNRFPGIFLSEDGKLGQRSSDAYKRVFGHFLAGDPRGG